MVKTHRPYTGQGPSIWYSHMSLSILKEKVTQTIRIQSLSTHPHAHGKVDEVASSSGKYFWSFAAKQRHSIFFLRTEVDRVLFQNIKEKLKNVLKYFSLSPPGGIQVSRSPQIQTDLKGIIYTVFKGTLCGFEHINEVIMKLERWQGPPNIKKVKRYETVLPFLIKMSSPKLHNAPF